MHIKGKIARIHMRHPSTFHRPNKRIGVDVEVFRPYVPRDGFGPHHFDRIHRNAPEYLQKCSPYITWASHDEAPTLRPHSLTFFLSVKDELEAFTLMQRYLGAIGEEQADG